MSKPDGGPAFPTTCSNYENPGGALAPGLSMRDYFAGQAMEAIVSSFSVSERICSDPRYDGENFSSVVAATAYEFADAMLAERAKP